jgi:uncharacterized membrane protein YfbV (UPF0208 family)
MERSKIELLGRFGKNDPGVSSADIKRSLNIEKLSEEVKELKQQRIQRRVFAICLFAFIAMYMCAVIVLVYLIALGVAELTDAVLVALLTTTTANVLGLFVIVAKYIFRAR